MRNAFQSQCSVIESIPKASQQMVRRKGIVVDDRVNNPKFWSLNAESEGNDYEQEFKSLPTFKRKGSCGWGLEKLRKWSLNKVEKCSSPDLEKLHKWASEDEKDSAPFEKDQKPLLPSAEKVSNGKEPIPDVQCSESLKNKSLEYRHNVLTELIDTERDYVRDLGSVVDGYIKLILDPNCEIPRPQNLTKKWKIIFGNIEVIYDWHKKRFLGEMEECVKHPEKLAPLFKNLERKSQMYVSYCKNKQMSEYVANEYEHTYLKELQNKLDHRLSLCDLLIKPVQRITKYKLIIDEIYKYTERAEDSKLLVDLKVTQQTITEMLQTVNDTMNVSRLHNFDGKISAQGRLLRFGMLFCVDGATNTNSNMKPKRYQVFLFEQIMIFSEPRGKKTQFTDFYYNYKTHFKVNRMQLLLAGNGDKLKFIIKHVKSEQDGQGAGFTCEAATRELHFEWVEVIRDVLQTQHDFVNALVDPIGHQKKTEAENENVPQQ